MKFQTKFKSIETQKVFDYLSQMKGIVNGCMPLLRFDEQLSNSMLDKNRYWLNVEYLNVLTHSLSDEPEGFRYIGLASQSLDDYIGKPDKLLLRIILRLADQLRSTKQDVNLLMRDYKLIRK